MTIITAARTLPGAPCRHLGPGAPTGRTSVERFGVDPDFVEADRAREETRCVRRYERSFMRPLFGGD
jgi:hypothetical protein